MVGSALRTGEGLSLPLKHEQLAGEQLSFVQFFVSEGGHSDASNLRKITYNNSKENIRKLSGWWAWGPYLLILPVLLLRDYPLSKYPKAQ